jgi:hypothetical protein
MEKFLFPTFLTKSFNYIFQTTFYSTLNVLVIIVKYHNFITLFAYLKVKFQFHMMLLLLLARLLDFYSILCHLKYYVLIILLRFNTFLRLKFFLLIFLC